MEEFEELDDYYGHFFDQRRLPVYRPACHSDVEPQSDDDETSTCSNHLVNQASLNTLQEHSDTDSDADDATPSEESSTNHCGCIKGCLSTISREDVQEHVFNLREMEKDTKEMYILGALNKVSADQKRSRYGERKRTRYEYRYSGHYLCKRAFCVIYDVSEATLKRMIKHVNRHGNVPRVHGNKGKRPKHAIMFEDAERTIVFISKYADEKGLPQPAAPRGHDGLAPIFLKSSKTKKDIHTKYEALCQSSGHRVIKYSTFNKIWNQCCPHIKIAKPEDDVCGKCEVLRKRVADARTDEDKLESSTQLQDHVIAARVEHQVYKTCVEKSVTEFDGVAPPTQPVQPCSTDYQHAHITFDFAQSVVVPHFSRQIGQLYFLSARKVHIFGVRDDGMRRQFNYLVDEGETLRPDGKGIHGPNGVISMLDHTLTNFSHGTKLLTLHSDNCGGQNKNRYVLAYMCWRTMTGLNEEMRYQMMIPGHARCLVDSGFGFIKMLYRRTDCETIDDVERVVNLSSGPNQAVRYEKGGQRSWEWRDWKAFLEPHFTAMKGIRKYQQFRFASSAPGVVYARTAEGEPEVEVTLCVNQNVPDRRPEPLCPAGLSRDRQQYLAKQVRPYLRDNNKETTCPLVEE